MANNLIQPKGSVSKETNIQSIARITGVKISEVKYLEDGLDVTGLKYLYDSSTETIWTLTGTEVGKIISWTINNDILTLNTTVNNYSLNKFNVYTIANNVSILPSGTVQDSINYITPEMFYTNPISDHTTAIKKSILYAIQSKKKLIFSSDIEYKISSNIKIDLNTDDVLNIDFSNAKITQIGNINPFSFNNNLHINSTINKVDSISEVSYNLNNPTTSSKVTKMTIPNHSFTEVGQIGKIYSDDLVSDSDASNQFIGEWFTVGAIDGNDIYSTGVLIENYTTNIKVCRPSNAKLILTDMLASSTWDDTINSAFITVRGFIMPSIRGTWYAENLNATFLSLTSCYFGDVQASIIGKRIKNNTALLSYGYLANDSASFGTQWHSINAQYTRHAFTTSTPSSNADDSSWFLKGRSMMPKVMNCIVQANACGIDTHSPAYKPHFGTITCLDDYRGDTAGGVALQIRANSARIDVLEAINPKVGLFFSGASKTSKSIVSVGTIRVMSKMSCLPLSITGSSSYLNKIIIDDFNFITENNNVISITNSDVTIKYLSGQYSPYTNGSSVIDLNDNASVSVLNGDIAFLTGNTHKIVSHNVTNTIAKIKLNISGANLVQYLATSASQYDIQSEFDVTCDSWNGNPFLGLQNTGAKAFANIRVGATSYPLRYRVYSYNVAGSNNIDLQNSGDSVIFLRFTVSIAGVVVSTMSKGAYPGQLIIMNNHTNSTQPILIKSNNAGLLSLGADMTIPINEGRSLIWDGSTWRRAS